MVSKPQVPDTFRKIAVWNTAFLGDAVLTLPLIRALKTAFPEAQIHFYVRKGYHDLFCAHPDLAAVHEVDKSGALRKWSAFRRFGKVNGSVGGGVEDKPIITPTAGAFQSNAVTYIQCVAINAVGIRI